MANRRMFSKLVTNSSKFLRMPATSRLLYYDLGMNADDDGFVEWYTVLQMTGAKEQDMQVLVANDLVKVFDEKVLVVIDWHENNYIRSDRYQPSKLPAAYGFDITLVVDGRYTSGIPNVSHMVDTMDTEVRIGKDSIGKSNNLPTNVGKEPKAQFGDENINKLMDSWKTEFGSKPDGSVQSNRRAASTLWKQHGEDCFRLIKGAAAAVPERYAPRITSFMDLRDKTGQLVAFWKKQSSNNSVIIR